MMTEKIEKVSIFFIILLALAIRLYPIMSGLPHTYWHDENNYVDTALRFGAAKFDMASFSHGGLYQMVLFMEYAIFYLICALFGAVHSKIDFFITYLKDPSVFFVMARTTSALCGTGIVYAAYLAAKSMFNARVALIASIFTAFSLLMIQMSSFALADMMSVFLELLAFLALLKSVRSCGDTKYYFVSCILIGLATATKYYTAFGAALVYTAAFIKSREPVRDRLGNFFRLAILGSLFMSAGFLAGMPVFLLNISKFYADTFTRMGGEYIVQNTYRNTWLFYFTDHLRNGLGIPLEILTLSGMAYAAFRHSKWDILLLSLPITYYLLLMHSMGFAYHLLPAMPFILILGARFLDDVAVKLVPKKPFYMCLILGILALAPTFMDSLKFVGVAASLDTRTVAKEWMDMNVPEGSRIMAEGYIFTTPVHGPPLTESLRTLERDRQYIILRGGSGSFSGMKIKNYGKVYADAKSYDIFKEDTLNIEDVEKIKPQYVVLSGARDDKVVEEFPFRRDKDHYLKREKLLIGLSKSYELIRSFSPTEELSFWFPHLVSHDYYLIRSIPFARLKHFIKGPRIVIFKLKDAGK
jgi:hypothetical protein